MIPAYSPQARGRSERSFGTWQGRLPQELRSHGITSVKEANRFLREHYIGEFNRGFHVAPAQRGSALVACPAAGTWIGLLPAVERTGKRTTRSAFRTWRCRLNGCSGADTGRLHRDGSTAPGRYDQPHHGPHRVGCYSAQGWPLMQTKTWRRRLWKRRALEKSQRLPDRASKSRKVRGISTCPQRRRYG